MRLSQDVSRTRSVNLCTCFILVMTFARAKARMTSKCWTTTERSGPFAFRPAWDAGRSYKTLQRQKMRSWRSVHRAFFNRAIHGQKKQLLQGPSASFIDVVVFLFLLLKKKSILVYFFFSILKKSSTNIHWRIFLQKKRNTITSLRTSQQDLRSLVPKNRTFQSSVFWDGKRKHLHPQGLSQKSTKIR